MAWRVDATIQHERAVKFLFPHRLLLSAGANPNVAGGQYGWTPLHWAASEGFIEGAALLIKHGAAVNAKTGGAAWTPLQCALDASHHRMYPILLSAGASLAMVNLTVAGDAADDAYIQRVVAAGSWANYERLPLDKLTAMLMPTPIPADGRRRSRRRLSPLRRVPPEVLRRIAAYAFHAGYY